VKFFPEVTSFTVETDAMAVRYFIREDVERFMRLKDPKGKSKGRLLSLTGEGSIFETLFSREDVCGKPVPVLMNLVDCMIALIWQPCRGERAGSHINNTETLRRTGLGDGTFDEMVFSTFNMPNLHEMNLKLAIKKWRKDGHMMGTTEEAMAGDSSEASF
jgi:hypothetical protein